MATKKTTIPLDEIRARLASPDAGVALTSTPEEVTGGSLQSTIAEVQAQQEQAVQPEKEFTSAEQFGALRRSTVTNYLTEALLRVNNDPEFTDFDPNLNHAENARKLLRAYQIPETDDALAEIGKGGTAEDQATIASRMAKHQFDLEVLGQHGVAAFAAQVVDPATLIVDLATFGTTKALKLGRTASALAGATANTSLLGVADAAGKDVTAFDYAATAALTGVAYGLFGGQAANNIASGQGNWFGKLQNPNTKQVTDAAGTATRFFSEADKVAPHAASRAVVKDLVDDPLRREEYFNNGNAATLQRRLDNIVESDLIKYDTAVEDALRQRGFTNKLARMLDLGGNYTAAKSQFNREVAEELLRRNDEFMKFGTVYKTQDSPVTKAADVYQEMMNRSGQIAKEHNLPGFEDFTPVPGYFHRAWDSAKIRQIGKKDAVAIVTQAIRSGIRGISNDDSGVIARAIIDRALAKEAGLNVDFLGLLGKRDTGSFVELLKQGGLSGAALDSAVRRLESRLGEKGKPKFAKKRLGLDMTVSYRRADGTRLRMTDLIDTDLDRLGKNYTASVNGRSALSKAGIGRDDAEINKWLQRYYDSISDLPKSQYDDAVESMQGIIGDFTGRMPEQNVLGPNAQRASSLATSTMLSAQGIWQGTEYATMAHKFGLAATAKEFFKQFPGVRQILKQINGKPDLVDELRGSLNLDLARDVRYRPWMQQHDAFLSARNSAVDRLLHFGKQAMPFITAQKYIHSNQTRIASNLALITFGKAMKGDKAAMARIQSYGKDVDWAPLFQRNAQNVTYTRNIATEMNWGLWKQEDVNTVMDTVIRYIDDAVLHGRSGQGAGFARTATGQILGQFRSFVGLAHNKLLRGTIHNEGALGMAQLLAYQYPLTVLMVTANEARKGSLDLESEDAFQGLLNKSIGYTAGLGFYADAANVLGLTGGRGGLSVPLLAAAGAPARAIGGLSKQWDDDTTNDDETMYDVAKAATMLVPVISGIPGTTAAIEAMKGD